jgi:[ribosomal protein S5]-alanine N-acetyltransferase
MSVATVDLVLLPAAALRALVEGDLGLAAGAAGVELPGGFLEASGLWRIRLEQIVADPASAPWLVRAVIGRPSDAVVGHAGFHGPPDDAGMVEVGYEILPEHRRQGYARAVLTELLAWAAGHGARTARASIGPDNVASRALVREFGFQHVGEQWDDEDGLELVFERPVPVSDC